MSTRSACCRSIRCNRQTPILWTRHLRHNPRNPAWPDRDRFVLSAGPASALLHSLLFLSGYDLGMDDLEPSRQWKSRFPGDSQRGSTSGVEVTTGPLGQGIANSVGLAMAERWLAATFNREADDVVDHYTHVLASDGDMMEGVAAEAIWLAGAFRPGRVTVLYDKNLITLSATRSRRTSMCPATHWPRSVCPSGEAPNSRRRGSAARTPAGSPAPVWPTSLRACWRVSCRRIVTNLVGGSADLDPSTHTAMEDASTSRVRSRRRPVVRCRPRTRAVRMGSDIGPTPARLQAFLGKERASPADGVRPTRAALARRAG